MGCCSSVTKAQYFSRYEDDEEALDCIEYTPMRLVDKRAEVEARMITHGFLTWVALPVAVVALAFGPPKDWQPTCDTGFNDWTFGVLAAYLVHGLWAESAAWFAVKATLTRPELVVMRQLGIFRKRGWLVLFGLIQSLGFYMDLQFPFMARSCGRVITESWTQAWYKVPIAGPIVVFVITHVNGFWGFALCLVSLNVVVGIILTFSSRRNPRGEVVTPGGTDEAKRDKVPRATFEDFYAWAGLGRMAMLPSVAGLCEAMADQRRYTYDPEKDTKASTESRAKVVFGKCPHSEIKYLSVSDSKIVELVENAAATHFLYILVGKVFVGNVLLLWVQASFFGLSFDRIGNEARIKVLVSMGLSAITAIVWSCQVLRRTPNRWSAAMLCVILFYLVWTYLKMYNAFICPHHVWNLLSGCANLSHHIK